MVERSGYCEVPSEGLGVEPGSVLDGANDLGLTTTWVGKRVHYRRVVGSTSSALNALAQ